MGFNVVGFSGAMGAGKTSAAKYLVSQGYTRMRFAKYLKDMLAAGGLTPEQIDGADKSKPFNWLDQYPESDPIEIGWDMLEAIGVYILDVGFDKPMALLNGWTPGKAIQLMRDIDLFGEKSGTTTPRIAMQLLGTEWGRAIDPDFWTKLWERDVNALIASGGKATVDDVRFPNEAELIWSKDGVVIRINAPADAALNAAGVVAHASEKLDFECDFDIYNEKKDLGTLASRIDGALEHLHDSMGDYTD